MEKKARISSARRRGRPELSESEPPPLSDFDKGVLHIVTLAEENLVKELGLPNREALAASGKIPAWWLATLMATSRTAKRKSNRREMQKHGRIKP